MFVGVKLSSCKIWLSFCSYLRSFVIFRMAAAVFHQSLGSLLSPGQTNSTTNLTKLNSKSFKVEVGVFRNKFPRFGNMNIKAIQASSSSSPTSVFDHISSPSINTTEESQKKQSKLVWF